MNAKYTSDGQLTIDIFDVINNLSPEEKLEFVESLACESEIIEFVTQQIIDGWTENGFHGAKSYSASQWPHGLDKAIREVAKASGTLAMQEITRLEEALRLSEKRYWDLANERSHRDY